MVGFRLDPEEVALLADLAEQQGRSRHELARLWVQERLENGGLDNAWMIGVKSLHSHLIQVRKDLALGVEAVLCATREGMEEEARAWVDKHLRGKPDAINQQSDHSGRGG